MCKGYARQIFIKNSIEYSLSYLEFWELDYEFLTDIYTQ